MDPRPWLHAWDPDAPRRLICFSPAGRGSSDFQRWRPLLSGGVDVLPVVLPGRERRLSEAPVTTWSELLDPLADRLAELVESSDTVLYGHSMGAWVAYEVLRRFVSMGVELPFHLVVGARRAPQTVGRSPPIAGLDDAGFVDSVQERYGAIPDAIRSDRELLSLFLPAMRADFALMEGYVHEPGPPLPVPITALCGRDDRLVPVDTVEPWGELTSCTFRIQTVSGGHFFLADAAEEVARIVAELFRREP